MDISYILENKPMSCPFLSYSKSSTHIFFFFEADVPRWPNLIYITPPQFEQSYSAIYFSPSLTRSVCKFTCKI